MTQPATTETGKLLTREQVTSAISTLVGKISSQSTQVQEKVLQDLYDLAEQIDSLYKELGRLSPASQIPSAHDELSAVVNATSEATFKIIHEAENLEKVGKTLPPEQAQAISNSVTSIYEACSFQDITGQRIKKVVGTLKNIEDRIDQLINSMGGQRAAAVEDTRTGEEALLNGPAMPGQGISQDEIDKLLGF